MAYLETTISITFGSKEIPLHVTFGGNINPFSFDPEDYKIYSIMQAQDSTDVSSAFREKETQKIKEQLWEKIRNEYLPGN